MTRLTVWLGLRGSAWGHAVPLHSQMHQDATAEPRTVEDRGDPAGGWLVAEVTICNQFCEEMLIVVLARHCFRFSFLLF